ncbi:hypothetical protein [Piscinibacter gummiphilus]|uniref:Uncharacterized protein n=1 Tax=Piscinibacter gummiphilus TaxID=946333 RepID=A0A1W6LE57_9BURK|nr:hypothetical protein [Piscinibacter gummiphilus]ARN22541.1 hypothetical protein A4W93_22975 [Piscinibacter gummiphilus]ATU67238.1 hypothetical protein CPZ87_23105 [Piscinibacter gummiphilus]
MKTPGIFALVFLSGLGLAAWLALRWWNEKGLYRYLPIAYGFAFGFSFGVVVLRATIGAAVLHGLLFSVVGFIVVLCLRLGRSRSRGPGPA